MTLNRRELRKIISDCFPEAQGEQIDRCADALLTAISGLGNEWGILHGANPLPPSEDEQRIEAVLIDLEKGLCRNIRRDANWQSFARFCLKETDKGRDYHKWVTWYMQDEMRAVWTWSKTPDVFEASYPQAFAGEPQQMTFEGRMKYNSKGELVPDGE